MSFKTILVHLDSESQSPHLLNAAVRLAGQNQSHLIGTYVAHPLMPYMARTGEAATTGEISKIIIKQRYEHLAKLEALFEKATHDQNFVAEWRFDKSFTADVPSGVLEQARSADVLLMSPVIRENETKLDFDLVAPVITKCSRPCIVVPESYQDKSLGDYVFVAWDGSRESSRAIFDALSMLKNASNVWLHRVKSSEEAKRHDDTATKDMADALARHGVKLEMSESTSATRKVGQELLNCATDRGADCIVMGAYGHSRLHGLLLGDVTRHLLENSKVPLFLSH